MSGRWFRPNFHVESLLRSIIQESHIIHRSELSGDHFHEWAMVSSKLSCREFVEIYNSREPHHSQKWAIWRPFSWVGDDFVQIFVSRVFFRSIVQKSHINHKSELSGDHFHEWAMISSKFSCREFLDIYGTKEPHQSQKWAIWRPFSWVGIGFVQIFMSRVFWVLYYKRATSFTAMSYHETIFMSGRRFRPNFHVEIFLRSIMSISFKFSSREFLEIYNTREPHQSQNWAIWRQFSWVGDDFVEIFMSRVSRDLSYKRATSFTEVSYLETIFMSGRWFRPNFHFEIFFQIYSTKEPHQSQKWAIWRPISRVGVDFVQTFMSRVSWDLWYKRATSITEVSYLETIFMSGH